MKKKISFLLSAASLCLGAAAQTVTVDDVEVLSSGETVSFYVHYAGISSMTSTHFEMALPAGVTIDKVEATADWTALFSHEGGVVGAISTTDNALSGEGDIAKVTINVPAKPTGTYPVTISNIRINGETLTITPSFNIIVEDQHSVVLDEHSTVAPAAASNVNVTVKRTIKAGEWGTICLPFSMTEAQVKAAFGDDVQLGDFTRCDVDDETGSIDVLFNDATAIEANHPYIIKVSADVSEFTAYGVNVEPEDEPAVNKDKTGSGRKTTYNSFIGTFVSGTLVPDYALFLYGNKFYFSTGKTTMDAFRAYFDLATAGAEYPSADATRMRISFNDGQTDISDLFNQKSADGCYYDLQGRRVQTPARGVYVRNGKKMVVK